MARWIKATALVLVLLLLAFTGWFVWASSGILPAEALATITTYTQRPSAHAASDDTLTVMTYNIGYLSGMTNNQPVHRSEQLFLDNLDLADRLIQRHDPDVIGFQEIDFGARRSYEMNQLDALARRGGFVASAAAINWNKRYVPFPGLLTPWVHFGEMLSGQAVLSRFPIRHHQRIVLQRPPAVPTYDPPLNWLGEPFYLDRLAQVVEVDVGTPLVIINVHLEAFNVATREQQARQVRDLYEHYRSDAPVLLIGDFNSPIPPTFRDRTIDILFQGTHLREAFPEHEYDMGTYPSVDPVHKIDHIFYDETEIEPTAAYVIGGSAQPSDHRAVVMRFVLKQ